MILSQFLRKRACDSGIPEGGLNVFMPTIPLKQQNAGNIFPVFFTP